MLVVNMTDNEGCPVVLSEQEKKVVELMRGIDFGELRIVINNSKPVRVEEIKKSVQL